LSFEAFNTLRRPRDIGRRTTSSTAHIEPGREGLFNLIKASPASLKCDPGVIVAEGDFVIVHGRFSGTGLPRNWIAADMVRIADGVLAEHWDVLQNEGLARTQRAVCRCSATASPIDLDGEGAEAREGEELHRERCDGEDHDGRCEQELKTTQGSRHLW